MESIEILILGEEMIGDYTDSDEYAITKALQRAGIAGKHVGYSRVLSVDTNKPLGNISDDTAYTVADMYKARIERKDVISLFIYKDHEEV